MTENIANTPEPEATPAEPDPWAEFETRTRAIVRDEMSQSVRGVLDEYFTDDEAGREDEDAGRRGPVAAGAGAGGAGDAAEKRVAGANGKRAAGKAPEAEPVSEPQPSGGSILQLLLGKRG